MTALLVLKSKIENFYEKHYRPVRSIVKGCLVFIVLSLIAVKLNFATLPGGHLMILGVSIICGLTPDIVSILCILAVTLEQIRQISPLLALAFVLIILIYYLIFGRMAKHQSILLISVPVLSVVHLEYLVPLVAGLFFTPVMAPAMIGSVLLYAIMCGIQQYALALSRLGDQVMSVEAIRYICQYLVEDRTFLVLIAGFLLAFVCTYMIRCTQVQYASQIGILCGTVVLLLVLLLSNMALGLDGDYVQMAVAILISAVIAYIVQFFHMTLDYQGTRKLQFEDDEYYYYVTAVPKLKVAVADKTLTRISPDDSDDNVDLKTELEKEMEEDFDSSDTD